MKPIINKGRLCQIAEFYVAYNLKELLMDCEIHIHCWNLAPPLLFKGG